MTKEEERIQRAAVRLLAEGYATPAEIANALGRSRQIVRHWAAGTDWKRAREARLKRRLEVLTGSRREV
jgi:DNA-binding CsgD family transcriptional regulator